LKEELKFVIDADAKTTDVKKAEQALKDVDKAAGDAANATITYRQSVDALVAKQINAVKGLHKIKIATGLAAESTKRHRRANDQMITSTDKARIAISKLAKADREAAAAVAAHAAKRKKTSVNMKMTAAVATAAAASVYKLAQAGFAATQRFAGFDDQMRKVAAVTGATGGQFAKMTALAEKMGANTRYTSTQAAEGMQFLAMAGLNAKQTMDALPGVLSLAAAGAVDLGAAADITTNILTGYGLKVKDIGDVNDVLVKAFTSSNTSLQDLGYAFSYVGPIAKASGASFNETAAILGKLADAGYKAEKGGTVLRGAHARLQKGMKPVVETLAELQIKSHDTNGRMRSMTDIIRDLAAKGITAKQSLKLFGTVAGPGMTALISQGAGSIDILKAKLDEAGGTSTRVANQMESGLGGAYRSLGSAWDNLIKRFGQAGEEATPGIKYITDLLKDPQVVQTLTDWGTAFSVIFSWVLRITAGMIETVSWLYQLTQFFNDDTPVKKFGDAAGDAAEKTKQIGTALTKAGQVNLNQPLSALGATSKALAKFEADAKRAYQTATKEAEKYATETVKFAQQIADANLTTEQKITEMKRQGMTEQEQKASREAEIQNTLTAMKKAAAQKDFATADRLAKHAETLYLANIDGNKKVSQAQLDGYEKIRQAYIDSVLKPQKEGAQESADAATASANKIQATLDAIKDKEIGVDFSVEDLNKMRAQIAMLTKTETKTINVKTVQTKSGGGRAVRMAGGGRLHGGTPGVDSIPVLAMAQEMFIQKPAVSVWDRALGSGFLDSLNNPWGASGRGIINTMLSAAPKLQPALPALPKSFYATGGRVSQPKAQNFGTLNLDIGGRAFPVTASHDVAGELTAHLQRIKKLRPNT